MRDKRILKDDNKRIVAAIHGRIRKSKMSSKKKVPIMNTAIACAIPKA